MKEKNKVDDMHSTYVIEDREFLMVSTDIIPRTLTNKSEWVMVFATSMHIYMDRQMFGTLFTTEDFVNIITRNDEKMKVQRV